MFDYAILGYCQYEILDKHNESFGCGELATHRVWWDGERDAMLVCPEHFRFIKETEEADIKGGE